MNDSINISGQVRFQIFNKDGSLSKDTGWVKNIITNAGKAAIAGLVGNTGSITAFTYLALGTSSTATDATQTALVAEITDSGLARAAATITRSTTTVTNDTLQLDYQWNVSGTKSVEEVAILNAASTGIMLSRALTGTLALTSGQVCKATYKVKFA